METKAKKLSLQAIRRMPYYLRLLKQMDARGETHVSSGSIAVALKIYEVQVRKDLASISPAAGRPRIGFPIQELIRCMEHELGYDNVNSAVLVGAGHLGISLMAYTGFSDYGLDIVAAFDVDEKLVGTTIHGKEVFALDRLTDLCPRLSAHIGIITVPAEHAQAVCDLLIKGGIRAIWNFAPVQLLAPEHILIQHENMASSLAVLSNHLAASMQREEE